MALTGSAGRGSATVSRDDERFWDVVVVGGGNAALVSALSASESSARVLLLERAPRVFRGGNSRHTRNIRCVHYGGDA